MSCTLTCCSVHGLPHWTVRVDARERSWQELGWHVHILVQNLQDTTFMLPFCVADLFCIVYFSSLLFIFYFFFCLSLTILAGVPVGGKSSVCLICMKYRIIILIIIINPPALNPAFPRRDPRTQPGFSPPPYVPMDKPTVNIWWCHLANRYYTKFTTCTSGISGISDTAFCLAFSLFLTC